MKNTLFILFLLFTIKVFSQEKPTKLILKTTPSYLFDIDNSFTLGAEYFLKKHLSIQTEVGYGNTNQNLLIGVFQENQTEQAQYRNFDVIRAKTELRFYSQKEKYTPPKGFYYAIEGFYKYVGKPTEISVGRNAINFVPDYWEKVAGRKIRQVFGSHFKIGRQYYIFDANPAKPKKWVLDVYMGIGFRNINNQNNYENKQPTDSIINNGNDFGKIFEGNGTQNIISGTMGFKLGYILSVR